MNVTINTNQIYTFQILRLKNFMIWENLRKRIIMNSIRLYLLFNNLGMNILKRLSWMAAEALKKTNHQPNN